MAIDFDGDDEDEGQTGGALRAKLEQALAVNKDLTDKLTLHQARDILEEKGLNLVKAEDLKGVPLDKIEEHASQIQEDRRALQESLLREALERQGFANEELDEALGRMVSEQSKDTATAEATRRARTAGSVEGAPIPRVDPSKLHGYDAIRAAVEGTARKTSR